ncbi:MAG: choice-of-anchor J domain-containing protein, partial [Phocaeicola sp.]
YHIVGCVYTQCNDTLLSAPLEFDEFISTECYTINTFPYVQNFEQTEVIPPVCWNRYLIKAPTSGTNFKEDSWTLLENESLAHSGSGAAMFQKCGYQTVATLVTPKFNFEAGKRYQLRFWMYRDELTASYKTNLRAFVTTNSSDTIGYRLCDIGVNTAESPAEVSKGYYEYIFEIPDTISGERYIVLAGLSLYYSYTTIYIDDVVVEEVPACQKIQRVHSSVISYSTANLWVETEENVNWQYVVLKGEETIESATPISVVGSDSTIVTGLDPDTEYRFYVRRDCGNGSYSEWSANVSTLTTPCMEGRAPYLETFESYTKGIEIINACFDFQRPSTYYKYPVIANSALDNEPYAGKQCVYAAHKGYLFRQFYFEAGKTYEVSVYATGANDDEATGYGDRITFFLSSSPASSGIITNFSTNNPVKSGWNRISATFTVPDPGYYYLGIEFVTNYGLGIDNLSVREIECLEPNNMSFSSITTTSAELMFLQNGVQTEVRVSSVDNGDLDPAFDILIDTISNNTIQITGLQPSTKYYYTLRSICANGSRSSWTTISSFYTLCESVSVPYSDGFEEGNTNFTCWSSMGLNKTAELSDSKHHRQGNSSVLLQNTTFTSPELNV